MERQRAAQSTQTEIRQLCETLREHLRDLRPEVATYFVDDDTLASLTGLERHIDALRGLIRDPDSALRTFPERHTPRQ